MKYISDKAIIIEPCILGKNIYIGPYSIIGPNVEVGDNTWIDSHVTICGSVLIGSNNRFFSFSNICVDNNQSYSFSTIKYKIIIGNDNVFCKNVNILSSLGFIIIGNKNYFMTNSYISNNCILRDNIFLSQDVFLASNIFIDSFVILSSFVKIYSNVNIGSYSFIGNNNNIFCDILPYMAVSCYPTAIKTLNLVFLKRYFFKKSSILKLKKIYNSFLNSNFTKAEIVSLLLSKKYFSFESKIIVDFLLKSHILF